MKILYILRHAKSSWDNPLLADFERSLNERGIKSACLVGEIIKKNNFQPDCIMCSPAKRAKQTAVLVKENAEIESEIHYDERIYEAGAETLLQIISEVKAEIESLLLVGHNPGLERFIQLLTGENQAMPTAGLAVVNLEIENWKEIADECGILQAFIRPSDEQPA